MWLLYSFRIETNPKPTSASPYTLDGWMDGVLANCVQQQQVRARAHTTQHHTNREKHNKIKHKNKNKNRANFNIT